MRYTMFTAYHAIEVRKVTGTTYEFKLTKGNEKKARRVTVDLSMNTSWAKARRISWDEVQIDSGARDSATFPRLPASGELPLPVSFRGTIYLNRAEPSIKAQGLPALTPWYRGLGKSYEFQTIVYHKGAPANGGRGGKRYYGFYADIIRFRNLNKKEHALLAIYDAGNSHDGEQLPALTKWYLLNDFRKGLDVDKKNGGQTDIGHRKRSGALFIERNALRELDELFVIGPDKSILDLSRPSGKKPETSDEKTNQLVFKRFPIR